MDEINRKDERRDSFIRKKKFKKIQGSSKLKETKRRENKKTVTDETHYDQEIK